jgi:hypothetical protein
VLSFEYGLQIIISLNQNMIQFYKDLAEEMRLSYQARSNLCLMDYADKKG